MPVPVLINRGGGAASADPNLAENVRHALASAGLPGEPRLLDPPDIQAACNAAAAAGEKLVIVGGGDGTISLAAGELAGTATALGILPLGTLNHFARDLGIPFDLVEAAALIASGQVRKIDVAELNGEVFINNSAIGLYPLLVRDREAQQHRLGRGKRAAMLVAALRTIVRFHHQRLRLSIDGRKAELDTPLLFVGNNDYRLEVPGPGRRDSLDEGKLCLFVLRSKSRTGFLAAVLRALTGRGRADDIVRVDDVGRLVVNSQRSKLAVSVDGEVRHLTPPLVYEIRPAALRVIAGAPAQMPQAR